MKSETRISLANIAIIIALMAIIAKFASDNYLPALPAIAKSLHTDHTQTKLTIMFYLLGMGLSQFIFGPISDAHGRKKVLLFGFCLFLFATLIAIVAPNIYVLQFSRLLQGIGMGALALLYKVIMRDVAVDKGLAKLTAYVTIATSVTPPLAPITGGYIVHYFNWRMNFVVIFVLSFIIVLIIAKLLPETLSQEKRSELKIKKIAKIYLDILKNKIFIINVVLSSLIISLSYIYLMITAFLYQTVIGLNPVEYGWLTVVTAACIFFSGFLNTALLNKFNLNQLITMSSWVAFFSSLVMLIFGLFGVLNLWVILVPAMFLTIGVMLSFMNFMPMILSQFQSGIATSTAIYSGLQMAIISIATFVAAYLPQETQIPMAALFTVIASLVLIIRFFIVRQNYQNQQN